MSGGLRILGKLCVTGECIRHVGLLTRVHGVIGPHRQAKLVMHPRLSLRDLPIVFVHAYEMRTLKTCDEGMISDQFTSPYFVPILFGWRLGVLVDVLVTSLKVEGVKLAVRRRGQKGEQGRENCHGEQHFGTAAVSTVSAHLYTDCRG